MDSGFSHNGKTLLSGVDPAGKADRVADAVAVADRTLYFCPAPLFGFGFERLLSRLAGTPNSALLCIEADPELFPLSLIYFPEALRNNSRLRLTNLCEAASLCAFVRQEWGPRAFRRIEIVRMNGGWQLFPELYNSLAESLRREIALEWGNAVTLTKLGRLYIRNTLRNLVLLPDRPSLALLSFGGEPTLVLGAGPSLDSLLDALPAHFGEKHRLPGSRPFRIVCVDTCLPALRERGIRPDLAVILESQHWNLEDFAGLSGWDIPAALDLSALPRSGTVLSGGLYLFFTPWTKLAIFGRLESTGLLPMAVPPLGSVGLSAVAIAGRLTGGTIITAGLDFSFTLDSYHARSTKGHLEKLRRQNRFEPLLNAQAAFNDGVFSTASKAGGKVLSNPALRHYRDLFERKFGAAQDNDAVRRIFDIAGDGLPLGIETLSAEGAIDVLCAGDTASDSAAGGGRKSSAPGVETAGKLRAFIRAEQERLTLMRNMLTGEAPVDHSELDTLIDECDYLWAHFPDYAAAPERRPGRTELEAGSASAISFLKRLRVEIDPFLRLWDLAYRDIE